MNKKKVFGILIIIALIFVIWFLAEQATNKDIDRIQSYNITVSPLDDGSLNLLYDITWEVLDSEKEGPLTWVQIGIPNSNINSLKGLSDNIKSIEKYNSTYVKIEFKDSYKSGDLVNFRFKFNQKDICSLNNDKVIFKFTPGWFTDIEVQNITVKWAANNVLSANTENRENGYYIWSKSLKKDEKLETEITYNKNSFKELSISSQSNSFGYDYDYTFGIGNFSGFFTIVLIIAIACTVLGTLGSDGYERHRGYGGYYGNHYHRHHRGYGAPPPPPHHHSSCVSRSSCACANSCACACAGGGRAGCSKKDFYGTKLKSKNIIDKL